MDTLLNILILSAKATGFIILFVFVVYIIIYIVNFLISLVFSEKERDPRISAFWKKIGNKGLRKTLSP